MTVICPATLLLHDPDDAQDIAAVPRRDGGFTFRCVVCMFWWRASATAVRRLGVGAMIHQVTKDVPLDPGREH